MKYLILLTFFHSFLAYAQPCTDVRLDKNGGVMEKVKPINQGSYGICYATAATAVYNAWLVKNNNMKAVKDLSAIHTAILYALDGIRNLNDKVDINGGDEGLAMRLLALHGACNKEYFEKQYDTDKLQESLNHLFELKAGYDASLTMKQISGFKKVEMPTYTGPDNFYYMHQRLYQKVNADITIASRAYHENPTCVQKELLNLDLETDEIEQILNKLYSGEFEQFGDELTSAICSDEAIVKSPKNPSVISPKYLDEKMLKKLTDDRNSYCTNPKVTYAQCKAYDKIYDKKVEELFKQTNDPIYRAKVTKKWVAEKLKPNALPIAIGYCAKKIGSFLMNLAISDDCGGHASVIIGRRKNPKTGTCQLLIRNSWGDDPSFTYNKKIESEGANFWVDEDLIYSSENLSVNTYE